ncbi:DUF1992 domain-containing protein [Cellulomonas sp. URHD0024]|uniref:DnaJ family domain-containing protein n=1 Tax=Cellulomonas sp. URHD0024 TaxID=1302620 RepID=UPI00040A1169|nr:DUF1992 domain-containing protein [Cellulomonas sp. URHD0024]
MPQPDPIDAGRDPVRDVPLDVARYVADRDAARDRAGREPGDVAQDDVAQDDGEQGDGEQGDGAQMPAGPAPMAGRMQFRTAWVDRVVDQAIARGEFDNLPLAGKPIPGIGAHHDPDWWLKALIEREQISGVLPEAIQLRKDDAVLDERLDGLRDESQVREALTEFNARIVAARRQLMGGPPVVTPLRDVEREVSAWASRRAVPEPAPDVGTRRRSWWR